MSGMSKDKLNDLPEGCTPTDAKVLRQKAILSYESILDTRKFFDKRYALTPRERNQLHMQELTGDSTRSYHQIVIAIAKAPG